MEQNQNTHTLREITINESEKFQFSSCFCYNIDFVDSMQSRSATRNKRNIEPHAQQLLARCCAMIPAVIHNSPVNNVNSHARAQYNVC